jgi:acyl-CoA hydrolase
MTEPTHPHEITMRFMSEPADVNYMGKVHGGMVMKWIDHAGYACAVGWSQKNCVTVYVGGIRFYRPILIGDLVELRARLIYTGTTSMHIAVDVWTTDLREGKVQQTTHCVIIFVALDADDRPTPVPVWIPKTDDDKALHTYASNLMELRQGVEEEMRSHINNKGD